MEAKLFEIRDKGTFIPMLGVLMDPGAYELGGRDAWLLRRAGYDSLCNLVLLTRADADGSPAHYDPHAWGGRTYPVAHRYIAENWDELASGDLIDVEFILGETTKPKVSEAIETYGGL